jgi:hypothetical protein
MLDAVMTTYHFEVMIENGAEIIYLDSFSEHAKNLDPDRGETLTWSYNGDDLLIHYLSKKDHLKNFPRSLLEDLKSGKAILVVGQKTEGLQYVIKQSK